MRPGAPGTGFVPGSWVSLVAQSLPTVLLRLLLECGGLPPLLRFQPHPPTVIPTGAARFFFRAAFWRVGPRSAVCAPRALRRGGGIVAHSHQHTKTRHSERSPRSEVSLFHSFTLSLIDGGAPGSIFYLGLGFLFSADLCAGAYPDLVGVFSALKPFSSPFLSTFNSQLSTTPLSPNTPLPAKSPVQFVNDSQPQAGQSYFCCSSFTDSRIVCPTIASVRALILSIASSGVCQ